MSRFLFLALPLVALAALVGVFYFSLERDPNLVRSVLIDKPAPAIALAPLEGSGVPGFDGAALKGEVTVVNVFASWCVPCRDEHPLLETLKERARVRLFGINQRDPADNALKFLAELGNPYDAIGADTDARASFEWGVYGVPETFVVDAAGTVTFKHVGPITAASLESDVLPAIERARAR